MGFSYFFLQKLVPSKQWVHILHFGIPMLSMSVSSLANFKNTIEMLSAFSIMGIVLNALSKEVNAMTTATNVDNIAIRERLGAYLERTGATKQSVASALGITTVTLASKLRGESLFDLEQAFRLADLMGCKVDDLRVRPFER